MKINIVVTLLLLLTGCGGATTPTSSQTPTPTPPSISPPTENSIVLGDQQIQTNQATELILYYPSKTITNINWQQTAGPTPVTFLANDSKVIAFTPTQAGNYSFSVTFTVDGVNQQTLTKTIDVGNTQQLLNARLGHSVLAGNKVSLRAWLDTSINNGVVTWQQLSGPTVTFSNYHSGDLAVYFNAPNVSQDTLMTFSVSSSINGQTYQDHLALLVENAPTINSNAYFSNRVAKVHPYRKNSPYANSLVSCVYSNQLTSSCTLGSLPLIAEQSNDPSIDDIMNRVVVSHQWMGQRFEQFLKNNDPHGDFKHLLRATTAIVIAYDVRPSFYWSATGAIYLDPNNFWLTSDERDTINEAPDYRSAFGTSLQFVMPWRYVKNNSYASQYFSPTKRVNRTEQQALYSLAALLYHELAHANDFFPSTKWHTYSSNTRVLDAAQSSNFESDQLDLLYPLNSQVMHDLAQVSFSGTTATATQQAYTPDDVATFFKDTGATDYYNFSSLREDYAMLFEEFMMYNRYQVQRDVAVTNRPTGNAVSASDYIVAWGERGRIGEAAIKPRIAFVASNVLPEFNTNQAIANLAPVVMMQTGVNWVQNLQLNSTIAPLSQSTTNTLATALMQQSMEHRMPEQRGYFHKPLPKH